MTFTTTTSTSRPSLTQAVLWRQAALQRLSSSRPAIAEALIGMPASIERLSLQRALNQLDLTIHQTQHALGRAQRLLADQDTAS